MASPCIGFEIGLGHICWYFRAYICSKILKVLHPCIGFGIGLGHIWGHANAWIWYIHAYAWILYIHVLSHISHIPKAEIFGFMFQYLSSERMGLRFWANPIHNTWLDHGEISRTRCTPFCPVMQRRRVWGPQDLIELLANVTLNVLREFPTRKISSPNGISNVLCLRMSSQNEWIFGSAFVNRISIIDLTVTRLRIQSSFIYNTISVPLKSRRLKT